MRRVWRIVTASAGAQPQGSAVTLGGRRGAHGALRTAVVLAMLVGPRVVGQSSGQSSLCYGKLTVPLDVRTQVEELALPAAVHARHGHAGEEWIIPAAATSGAFLDDVALAFTLRAHRLLACLSHILIHSASLLPRRQTAQTEEDNFHDTQYFRVGQGTISEPNCTLPPSLQRWGAGEVGSAFRRPGGKPK